jgi:hypothetical protein
MKYYKYISSIDKTLRLKEYNHEYYLKHRDLVPKVQCPHCKKQLAKTVLERDKLTNFCKKISKSTEKQAKKTQYSTEALQNIITDVFQDMSYTSDIILDNARPKPLLF